MSSIEVTPPRPRWERRKESRPAELLSAALDLFVEKGYAGTRLEDVATRAGVSKGTLYLYFQNKEELFKAVVRENIVTPLAEAAQEAREFDGPTANRLHSLDDERCVGGSGNYPVSLQRLQEVLLQKQGGLDADRGHLRHS